MKSTKVKKKKKSSSSLSAHSHCVIICSGYVCARVSERQEVGLSVCVCVCVCVCKIKPTRILILRIPRKKVQIPSVKSEVGIVEK